MTVGFFLLNREMVSSPHIATYKIFGTIYDDPERQVILKQIADDDDVYGVIVEINSPGGTVVGAEALYESLIKIRKKKPIVVSIGEVGASAAYIAALAGDKIIARGNSLVGSIGVIVQYPDLSKLAELLGISIEVVKSGKSKGGTNFLEPASEEVMKNQELLVNDSFVWFKDLVRERRALTGFELERVSGGELYTGRMALELGLVDSIGSMEQAVEYFQEQGKKFKGIGIIDWTKERQSTSIWKSIFGFENPILGVDRLRILHAPVLFSIAG